MDNVTAAYIAGILDGEGCFMVEKFRTTRSPIGFQFRSRVELQMCDKDVIDYIAEKTGRAIRSRLLPSGRTVYVLNWRNAFAVNLIRTVLPYLIGKREQAEICLDYETNIAPGRGRTYSQADLAKCDAVRKKLTELKHQIAIRC